MDASFGARLRAQRERQQVTLGAISEETKIKLSILEGLERGDVSQWPEGIFRRAYVRAYARAVGLDPETLVREFLQVHPEPVPAPSAADATELENPQWPAGFRRVVSSAMSVPTRRRRGESATPEPARAPDPSTRAAEPRPPVARPEPGLPAAAELCTRLGRATHAGEAKPILHDAVDALDAVGLIVWSWDARAAVLSPALACGYGDAMLAQIPALRADADNAIASAFRTAGTCLVHGAADVTGAVAVPLLAPGGCVGVLAVELRHGDEGRESIQAFVTILAAQLVPLVGSAPLARAVSA